MQQLELIPLGAILALATPSQLLQTESDRPQRMAKNRAMPESKPRHSAGSDSGITVTAFVETYCPRGTARGQTEYYRLRYWDSFAPGGGRWRHKHIKGGNIHSPLAKMRAEAIKEAIKQGRSPQWVKSLCG